MNQNVFNSLQAIGGFGGREQAFAILRLFRSKELIGIYVVGMEQVNEKLSELRLYYGDEVEILPEVPEMRLRLLIMGAGHVGKSLSCLGSIIGYDVIIVDDRIEFLNDTRFADPTIKIIEEKFDELRELNLINDRTAVAIVTRGHQFDEVCLRQVLAHEPKPKYIGMIGSKRRVELIKKRLAGDGFSREDLTQLHAPIGLQIGAVTPQEIAVAILAEIINKFRNK